MAELLVIVPSRGRPASVAALCRAWELTWAIGDADLLFGFDDDDPALAANLYALPTWAAAEVRPRMRLVEYTNALAVEAADAYRYVGSIGDDHRPRTAQWSAAVRTALAELGTGIVYGDDLLQGSRLPTAVFMTSDIVTALGYMAPPELEHQYCDNVWLNLGLAVGRLRYMPEIVVEHVHPAAGKAPSDALYDESGATMEQDGARFRAYMASRFAADAEKIRSLCSTS